MSRNGNQISATLLTLPDAEPDNRLQTESKDSAQYYQTLEDSASFSSFSDIEADTGIQSTPYAFPVYDNKGSGSSTDKMIESSTKEHSHFTNTSNTKTNLPQSFTELSPTNKLASTFSAELSTSRKEIKKTATRFSPFRAKSKEAVILLTISAPKMTVRNKAALKCQRIRANLSTLSIPQAKNKASLHHLKFHSLHRGDKRKFLKEESVIEELEENMLTDYWQRKEEIEEKYKQVFSALEVEEATEIRMKVAQLLVRGRNATVEFLTDVIAAVKEEYGVIKSLIIKQRILEEEETISQYEKIISAKS